MQEVTTPIPFPRPATPRVSLNGGLLIVALLGLWCSVVRLLGAQWSFYPQYNYGWAVPFLCAYFVAVRLREREALAVSQPAWGTGISLLMLAALALVLPTRIIQEANPIWRAPSYGLAIEAIAVTFLAAALAGGGNWTRRLAFPLLFFLVAVPWPSQPEAHLVDTLMGTNTSIVTELLGWLGIPAFARGNVIQVATGLVGVEEACSGIRSLQATLMIGLALGEVYRLTAGRRVLLVLVGEGLAFLFNIVRTLLLTVVAAKEGINAISEWHDPAGVTILLGCLFGLWGFCVWLAHRQAGQARRSAAATNSPSPAANPPRAAFGEIMAVLGNVPRWLPYVLIAVLVAFEGIVPWWFRRAEQAAAPPVSWTLKFPQDNSVYHRVPISESVSSQLRYDEGGSLEWNDPMERHWQLFYFRWLPAKDLYSRVKVAAAKAHRPERCLTGVGLHQVREETPVTIAIDGVELPFRKMTYSSNGRPLQVFYCIWEEGTPMGKMGNVRNTAKQRLLAAWNGNRGLGQRSIEAAVSGTSDLEGAFKEFQEYLKQMMVTHPLANRPNK